MTKPCHEMSPYKTGDAPDVLAFINSLFQFLSFRKIQALLPCSPLFSHKFNYWFSLVAFFFCWKFWDVLKAWMQVFTVWLLLSCFNDTSVFLLQELMF